jgi:hypothetical protein
MKKEASRVAEILQQGGMKGPELHAVVREAAEAAGSCEVALFKWDEARALVQG